ncbi:MAG: glycosyltransferase, partial [Treponema sp.]|nr:glycosyltransferase [Treponema sp.]
MDSEFAPLVSVIIPMYNVENYIAECLDSTIAQTYKNLDIVIVDDGSTDRSNQIASEY